MLTLTYGITLYLLFTVPDGKEIGTKFSLPQKQSNHALRASIT